MSVVRERSRSRSPREYNSSRRRSRSRSNERKGSWSRGRSRSPRNEFSSHRKDKKSSLEIQSERRRMERERICSMGVPEAWGLSPKAPMDDSEDDVEVTENQKENHTGNKHKITKNSMCCLYCILTCSRNCCLIYYAL